MSKHGSSACASILLLAHATHLHLRRLPACLAGTRTACSRLVATCFTCHIAVARVALRVCGSSGSGAARANV